MQYGMKGLKGQRADQNVRLCEECGVKLESNEYVFCDTCRFAPAPKVAKSNRFPVFTKWVINSWGESS